MDISASQLKRVAAVLNEIRVKHGEDAFSLCSILDVCDEMTALYGRGNR